MSGQEILHKLEAVPTNSMDKPIGQITITDCGEVKLVKDEKEEQELRVSLSLPQLFSLFPFLSPSPLFSFSFVCLLVYHHFNL